MEKRIDEYEAYLKEQELADGTVSTYIRYARQIEYCIKLSGASKKTVLDYKQKLKQKRIAPSTLNLAIIAVNKYLKFAGYKECAVKTEKVQKRKSLENVISIDEYRRMLRHAKTGRRKKYYYIMRTLAQTGIRVSELKYFTVEVLEKKKIQVISKGKIREIFLPNGLIQELYEYCEENGITGGVIFKGSSQNPIGRSSVYKMLMRIGTEAGISKDKVYPHSFRHLFAVTYMNSYGNLTELADILGHSSLETTRIYTLTTAEEKRKRMDNLGL